MGDMINAHKVLIRNMTGKDYFKNLHVNWRILKWMLKKYGVRVWTAFTCLRTGSLGREYRDYLSGCWLLNKECAPSKANEAGR
jgi:hypothetical protein